MSSLKERMKEHAGVAAFAVSAAVFGFLSLTHAKAQGAVMVPIMSHFIAPGSRVKESDIHWVSSTTVHSVNVSRLLGYARVPLYVGEVLSPQEIGGLPNKTVVVAVTPTNGSDVNVAATGDMVDILVLGPKGVRWQSGALLVEGTTDYTGSGASINVTMSLAEAMVFERVKALGTVELVGMTS